MSGDVNTPVGDTAAFRLNAVYEGLGNHRDVYGGQRFAINPYLAADLGDGWRAGLSYEYVDDDRATDRGVPSFNGRPIEGYRDRFFGVPRVNRTTFEAHILKGRIDGEIQTGLSVSTTVLYGDFDKLYTNVFPNGPATGQTGTVPLAAYTDPTSRENLLVQSNLLWDTRTGSLKHGMRLVSHMENLQAVRTAVVVRPGKLGVSRQTQE